jgi:hypothetical protein
MKHPALRIIIIALLLHLLIFALFAQDSKAATYPDSKELPCQQWHQLMRDNGLPVKVFAGIMYRESRCQQTAVGWNYKKGYDHDNCKLSPAATYRKCKSISSYDIGLLQVNSTWKSLTYKTCKTKEILTLQKPSCNLAVAAVIYNKGLGLGNWRATSNGNINNK